MTERGVERRLAAILAADVVGYSRMIGRDETGTLARLRQIRHEIVNPVLAEHGGRIFKLMGDGMLAEFPSAVEALRAAIAFQRRMRARNAQPPEGEPIEVRIGVHQGDIVVEGRDLLGDGVNVASRLEALAEPGGICISARLHEDAMGKIAIEARDMGERWLKNIDRPVRAYRVLIDHPLSNEREGAAEKPALSLPDKPSIAVLAFQNMSDDAQQDHFADGVVQDITTALSRFRQLFVTARNSSFTYKGRAVDVKQIGRELGVRYVLEGSVRKASGRVRMTGQLIDATNGAHLWADHFDGKLGDIFDLHDQMTAKVVGAIVPKLEQVEIERARRKPTDSLDAYDCFLRGLANYHRHAYGQDAALRLFNRAIELDPDFASAYALAAICHLTRKTSASWTDPQADPAEAARLARRAVVLGRDDALALAMSGKALAHMERDLDTGVALTERALSLNPNLTAAWFAAGWLKIWLGEPDAAVGSFERAMRQSPLDPLTPRTQNGMAHAHFFAGRYDEASCWASKVLRDLPDFHDGLRITAASNALAGRADKARAAIDRLLRLDPELRISELDTIQGPYRRHEDMARYVEAMRKAGLPE